MAEVAATPTAAEHPWLRKAHIAAAVAHAGQAVYGAALAGSRGPEVELTNDVTDWRAGESAAPRRVVGTYRLAALAPAFSAASAVNHAWAALDQERYGRVVQQGYNPVRWGEYAISAGVMNWGLLALSGATDVKPLVAAGVLNAAMQYCGYAEEVACSKALRSNGNQGERDAHLSAARGHELNGYVLFAGFLALLLTAFFTSTSRAAEEGGDVPDAVYATVLVIAALYAAFGLLATVYRRGATAGEPGSWWQLRESRFERVEAGYLGLSLVAKSFLANMLLFGALAPDSEA